MTYADIAMSRCFNDRPSRSRNMLLMHEELARARMRDRRAETELRSLQLAVARPRHRRVRAASRRARLVLRPVS